MKGQMNMGEHFDFCGYATKNDLLCSDGRTIRKDAFKGCDGLVVPLVWNHRHDDPEMVLGHALLENRNDGVYMYGKFNDTDKGQACKKIVGNKDIKGLSIYANKLKQKAGNVLGGVIREVSLVLAGANPGATIDFSLSHSDSDDDEVYVYLVGDEYTEFQHGDIEYEPQHVEEKEETMPNNEDDNLVHAEEESSGSKSEEKEETIQDVFNTLTDKQKDAVYAVMAYLEEDKEDDNDEEDEEVKHNVFENEQQSSNYLSHSDMELIFKDAKRLGSLRDAVNEHMENGVLAHAVSEPDSWGVSRATAPQSGDRYGIYEPEMLFPDYKALNNVPEWIRRDTGWVQQFMGAVRHTPFSRIKTLFADITADEARALGYIKGNLKKEEFFTLIKRTTDPQTIYKKQKMDRDDVIDITDFDVVAWLRGEMRMMLEEEIARAALIGDGRLSSSDDKIQESHIRPILTDSELFTIRTVAKFNESDDDIVLAKNKGKALIRAAIKARKDYKGSGTPTFYTTEDVLSDLLLMEDEIGHLLYTSEAALATALRVSRIVTVPVMENLTTAFPTGTGTQTESLAVAGIIVNPTDYTIGADKGGAISMFDDFDIDYNRQKYLIETRCSGALVRPKSAIVIGLKEVEVTP